MSHTDPKNTPRKDKGKPWEKPRLERLGTIADIAGTPPPLAQANNNKHS